MKQALYVPIMGSIFHKYPAETLASLKAAGADDIFYVGTFPYKEEEYAESINTIRADLPVLNEAGYSVGIWLQSLGFGQPLSEESKKYLPFRKITTPTGKTMDSAFCPTDENFVAFYCGFIQDIIRAGAKKIMFDDELCLNIRPGLGCACDEHMRRFCEEVGEDISRDQVYELVFAGEPNRYRAAWAKVMGDSMKDFCKALRKAADEIDPSVRLGFCSGYTSWDLEGADALELTEIFAGNNEPFLRYSSAPYWEYTNRFPWQPEGHIVEFCRQQIAWCKDRTDIDLFIENDTYPRPRTNVPSFASESYDFMLSAASAPGQLKYLLDYVSSPGYEQGYLNAHLRNRDLIHSVAEAMGTLPAAGIYVHEDMRKFTEMTLPAPFSGEKQVMRTVSFSSASALLSANSIPVTYENQGGITAAFGDSGRTVPLSQKAYIIDIAAAEELMKRGVDVGIISYQPAARGSSEYFYKADDSIRIEDGTGKGFVKAILAPAAQVQSEFVQGMPSSYVYENGQGMKFLVFLFRGDFIGSNYEISSSYYRQEQIIDFCRSVGDQLPVCSRKNPNLHIICKETDDVLAVAYCNYGNDLIENPFFQVAGEYASAQTFGCSGKMEEDGFRVDHIPARTFGAFLLKKN